MPISPATLLFSDLPESEAAEWTSKLHGFPGDGWNGTVTYCGWRDVPSVYVLCTQDATIPPPLQEQLAASAGSKVEKLDAGHMPQVSQPDALTKLVKDAVQSFETSA